MSSLESRGIRVVAASIDAPDELRMMRDSSGAGFDFYSDPGGLLIELLGVRHRAGRPMDGADLPQSSRFLIDSTGKVLWSHLSENYRVRPRPELILQAIDGLDLP